MRTRNRRTADAMIRIAPPLALSLLLALPAATPAQTIKKCQDASGKWHYGDIAAEACARSLITEIDDRGLKVDEHTAPPTEKELEAERAAQELRLEQQRRAEEQRRREDHLLAIYDSEQSILRARDERVASIDRILKSDERYKAKLQENLHRLEELSQSTPDDQKLQQEIGSLKDQINEYEAAIDSRLRERELVMSRYNTDLNRYREIVRRRQAAK